MAEADDVARMTDRELILSLYAKVVRLDDLLTEFEPAIRKLTTSGPMAWALNRGGGFNGRPRS